MTLTQHFQHYMDNNKQRYQGWNYSSRNSSNSCDLISKKASLQSCACFFCWCGETWSSNQAQIAKKWERARRKQPGAKTRDSPEQTAEHVQSVGSLQPETCGVLGVWGTRNSDSDTPGEAKMQILLPRDANVDAMPLRMHKMGMSGGEMFHSCVWYGAVQFDSGLGLTGPCGGMHSTDCHFSWTGIYLSVYPVNDN